jgi:hypothetical protein
MKNFIKDWWSSLWPYRFIIPLLFMFLMGFIIWIGFELPVNPNDVNMFQNPYLWYGGNVIGWIIIDMFLGLGRYKQ